MSKKKEVSQKDIKNEELDVNGNPIDPNREYIGNRVKVPMASPNSSIYKTPAITVIKGKSKSSQEKKKAKLLEFLSRAPISFDEEQKSCCQFILQENWRTLSELDSSMGSDETAKTERREYKTAL